MCRLNPHVSTVDTARRACASTCYEAPVATPGRIRSRAAARGRARLLDELHRCLRRRRHRRHRQQSQHHVALASEPGPGGSERHDRGRPASCEPLAGDQLRGRDTDWARAVGLSPGQSAAAPGRGPGAARRRAPDADDGAARRAVRRRLDWHRVLGGAAMAPASTSDKCGDLRGAACGITDGTVPAVDGLLRHPRHRSASGPRKLVECSRRRCLRARDGEQGSHGGRADTRGAVDLDLPAGTAHRAACDGPALLDWRRPGCCSRGWSRQRREANRWASVWAAGRGGRT